MDPVWPSDPAYSRTSKDAGTSKVNYRELLDLVAAPVSGFGPRASDMDFLWR